MFGLVKKAYAQIPTWTNEVAAGTPVPPAQIQDLEALFARAVKFAAWGAGIGLFIMLVVGGVKFITSHGDPQAAASAKQTITFAVVGLLVIVGGWLILSILGKVLGINLLQFTIPTET